MPRYTLKAIFVAATVLCLWLSTIAIDAGEDIRRFIILLVVVASVAATYSSDGQRRAFWLSFALVMLIMAVSIFRTTPEWPVPTFYWAIFIKPDKDFSKFYFVGETVRAVGTLAIAMIAGFAGDFIYDQTRKSDDA
jgi:hypothetical protein